MAKRLNFRNMDLNNTNNVPSEQALFEQQMQLDVQQHQQTQHMLHDSQMLPGSTDLLLQAPAGPLPMSLTGELSGLPEITGTNLGPVVDEDEDMTEQISSQSDTLVEDTELDKLTKPVSVLFDCAEELFRAFSLSDLLFFKVSFGVLVSKYLYILYIHISDALHDLKVQTQISN